MQGKAYMYPLIPNANLPNLDPDPQDKLINPNPIPQPQSKFATFTCATSCTSLTSAALATHSC